MSGDTGLFNSFGITVDPGVLIFQEGDVGDKMYIIQSGNVRVSKIIEGKEHELAVLGKGDFFGEMAIVTNEKRTATVKALNNTSLLAFDRQGFLSLINKNAKIALNIIEKLCRRLQKIHIQVQHMVRKNSTTLVALHLSQAFKNDADADGRIPYDLSLNEISLNLELPFENVESIINEFQKDGIITIEENELILESNKKLKNFIEKCH
ncbi:MAG: Crp/Fnr family transcriptional regulator [Spirochaetales bacterium]|nr:Crp/Fnr family transcriptional regulator [Spirochaetales bacterium]